MRHMLLCLMALSLGCNSQPTGTDEKEQLVGKTEAEVEALLGAPTERTEWKLPQPHFGPKPSGLPAGTRFTALYYANYRGQQRYVLLVSPDVYKQHKGKDPGQEPLYVFEVATFPKGTVF